jgi:pyrroline-5-carboxylate reductase
VLAVKPQGFGKAASSISGWIGADTLVVSIMAGVTIRGISEALGVTKVARAMPNTPGAIGKGVTGYALSAQCGEAEKATAEKLLAPLGDVVGPLEEKHIDAVTAVSGSGPAYVFLLAEALEGAAKAAWLGKPSSARERFSLKAVIQPSCARR